VREQLGLVISRDCAAHVAVYVARLEALSKARHTRSKPLAQLSLNALFDAVVCSLGLMFFPEPAMGLSEFRRVLRPGGRAAVSVNTVPERSYNHQINIILTRYVPSLTDAVTRTFSLGDASRLQKLFNECGFSQIETPTVKHTFVLPSCDAYYGPFERGGASTARHWQHCVTKFVEQCATKCGATSATRAGQSRSRPSTESPAAAGCRCSPAADDGLAPSLLF
jgi:SAM-dependent methyltransferase